MASLDSKFNHTLTWNSSQKLKFTLRFNERFLLKITHVNWLVKETVTCIGLLHKSPDATEKSLKSQLGWGQTFFQVLLKIRAVVVLGSEACWNFFEGRWRRLQAVPKV